MDTILFNGLPEPLLDHANRCAHSSNQAVQSAYLTGVIAGMEQGYELYRLHKDKMAEYHAEHFIKALGTIPALPGYDFTASRHKLAPLPEPAVDVVAVAQAGWAQYQLAHQQAA